MYFYVRNKGIEKERKREKKSCMIRIIIAKSQKIKTPGELIISTFNLNNNKVCR